MSTIPSAAVRCAVYFVPIIVIGVLYQTPSPFGDVSLALLILFFALYCMVIVVDWSVFMPQKPVLRKYLVAIGGGSFVLTAVFLFDLLFDWSGIPGTCNAGSIMRGNCFLFDGLFAQLFNTIFILLFATLGTICFVSHRRAQNDRIKQ